ncbi:MAG TPA: Clp protease N-terminal domain-containing protein [Longimicrobium sp.]|nr:Clp protease N-terminal domain-containing protein [Longimicrobium sp.]
MRVTLEDLLHRRPRQDIGAEDLPYTSRAKKVLEFAMAEAREFNHTTLTPEHLLLGLLREEKGLAAEALTLAGLTLEDLRPLVRDDFPEDLPSDIIETAGVNRGPRRLLISVELPMWADSDAVAELIAEFVAGLSQLHIYAGGEGLTVDGIEIDVTATVGGSA